MQYFHLFASIFLLARLATCLTLENISDSSTTTTRLSVPDRKDVFVKREGPGGKPLSSKKTTILLNYVELEIYRECIARGRDIPIGDQAWERETDYMKLKVQPYSGFDVSWGEVIFGVAEILGLMLNPRARPTFHEQEWVVGRVDGSTATSLAIVAKVFLTKKQQNLSNSSLNSTTWLADPNNTSSSAHQVNGTLSSSGPLAAPYPIPGTDVTLLVGTLGPVVHEAFVIPALDSVIGEAWRNLVIKGYVSHVRRFETWVRGPDDKTRVIWGPTRIGTRTVFFTELELVEMIYGLICYMLDSVGGFFATKIIAVRPAGRRRVQMGEMEIFPPVPNDKVDGPKRGNNSLIQES